MLRKHNFDEVFDTSDPLWQKVLDIIEKNQKYPKKIVKGRNLHHIYPRSFSKKHNEPVDNDKENLISLTVGEHYFVHYCYYKLARKGYRQSMSLAFLNMAKKALKYTSNETAESIAKDIDDNGGNNELYKSVRKRHGK